MLSLLALQFACFAVKEEGSGSGTKKLELVPSRKKNENTFSYLFHSQPTSNGSGLLLPKLCGHFRFILYLLSQLNWKIQIIHTKKQTTMVSNC